MLMLYSWPHSPQFPNLLLTGMVCLQSLGKLTLLKPKRKKKVMIGTNKPNFEKPSPALGARRFEVEHQLKIEYDMHNSGSNTVSFRITNILGTSSSSNVLPSSP